MLTNTLGTITSSTVKNQRHIHNYHLAWSPSTDMSAGLANFYDIPYELLAQIFVHLDNATLFSLGKVNHHFNYVALLALFGRNQVAGVQEGHIVSRLAPPEIVPALNAALWITDLHSITYHFNSDFDRMVQETRGLEAFIRRLSNVGHVAVYFANVDNWLEELQCLHGMFGSCIVEKQMPALGRQRWRKAFMGLVDSVLAKANGRVDLLVSGGDQLREFYVNDEATMVGKGGGWMGFGMSFWAHSSTLLLPALGCVGHACRLDSVLKDALFRLSEVGSFSHIAFRAGQIWSSVGRWIRGCFDPACAPHHDLPSPPSALTLQEPAHMGESLESEPISRPCLSNFQIRTSMLLEPPFFHKTIHILQTQAPALRELYLIGAKATTDVWHELFSSIHLPALETFCYMIDTPIIYHPTLTLQIVHDFLVRHPTIQSLELYGIIIPPEFPELQESILPNLTRLDAHPQVVAWFLKDAKQLPKLDTVHITSEYTASWMDRPNTYAHFDEGILSVSTHPRATNLHFKFNTELELLPWLMAHIDLGRTGSALGQLVNVNKLTISCQQSVDIPRDALVNVVPRWLCLFPSLEEFVVADLPCPDEVLEFKEFHVAVVRACPGLKRFMVCDKEILLN